jgi:hypothetical protein
MILFSLFGFCFVFENALISQFSFPYAQMTHEFAEGESESPKVNMEVEDGGLAEIEEKLRRAVRGNSHNAIQSALESPNCELDVPLCRMIPMKDVREPLKTDIQKLKAEFSRGYRRASACFYLSLRSFRMEEATVTETHRASWSDLWRKEDLEFEARLAKNPALEKYSNRFFYVWDGNHRHIAWMDVISALHKDDAIFHVPVRSVFINVSSENCNMLLHAMTDWNK